MYVIVGFRTDQKKSVLYAFTETGPGMAKATRHAFEEKGAHFVSIRRVEPNENSKSD